MTNGQKLRTPPGLPSILGAAALVLALVGLGLILSRVAVGYWELPSLFALWLLGATGLGVLTGYVTGASTEDDKTGAFLTFLATGVIAPLVGQIAILVEGSAPTPLMALGALGGFFLFYSLFAALGFFVGVWGKARDVTMFKMWGS